MSCSPFDLRDYVLKELPDTERHETELHVKRCGACRDKVEQLRLTEAALFALPEEEIPQRIAFVSDKIFEPTPWRRTWAAFWGSTARLGFVSAAMLSTALIVFSLAHTAGSPAAPPTVGVAKAAVSDAEIEQRIQTSVAQAVAGWDTRVQQLEHRVTEIGRHNREQEQLLVRAADAFEFLDRQNRLIPRSSFGPPLIRNGESK